MLPTTLILKLSSKSFSRSLGVSPLGLVSALLGDLLLGVQFSEGVISGELRNKGSVRNEIVKLPASDFGYLCYGRLKSMSVTLEGVFAGYYLEFFVVGNIALEDMQVLSFAQLSLDLFIGGRLAANKANDRVLGVLGQLVDEFKLIALLVKIWLVIGSHTPKPREAPVTTYEAIGGEGCCVGIFRDYSEDWLS